MYVARPSQALIDHLQGVADISSKYAAKLGLGSSGRLVGLMHDMGKYSDDFQKYIALAGIENADRDDTGEHTEKGSVDHSTSGAQWLAGNCGSNTAGQILSICAASHHGGLIDVFDKDGYRLGKRINKEDSLTHYTQVVKRFELIELAESLLHPAMQELKSKLKEIVKNNYPANTKDFMYGMLIKFLYSCLIDADRLDSAAAEAGTKAIPYEMPDWEQLIDITEKKCAEFAADRKGVNGVRNKVSENCLRSAENEKGIYTLTVPTGGGKTFASLRYALHHARKHKLDHIIYVVPYTAIIEQNVIAVRNFLDLDEDDAWILEHHSNLEPEKQNYLQKIRSESWDMPIIFTTAVQFLNVLFAGGTRGARRMHQLANSLIIFDEAQSLPLRCVHIFCNALTFLVKHAGSSAVLCTATQPLFDRVDPEKGALHIDGEIIDDIDSLFDDLKRVEVINLIRNGGYSVADIVDLAVEKFNELGSILIVTNTKRWAKDIYLAAAERVSRDTLVHLSTNMCPAHRKKSSKKWKTALKEASLYSA